VQKVLEFTGDVGVVVDQHWQELFALRADDPLEIVESCRVVDGCLVELGQPVPPGQRPDAQYIGLVCIKLPIFKQLMRMYDEILDMTAGAPWRNSSSFVQAYLTDFLQEAIDRGYAVQPIEIEGGWFEFDTPRDLAAARQLALEPKPHVFDLNVLTTRPTVISAGGVAIRGSGDHREVLLVGSGEKGGWRIPKGMLEPGEAVEDAARFFARFVDIDQALWSDMAVQKKGDETLIKEQTFERGRMVYIADENTVYVLFNDGGSPAWTEFENQYDPYWFGGRNVRVTVEQENYFFMNEKGEIARCMTDMDNVLKFMGDKEKEVQKFAKANKLDIERREHMIQLVDYYNSLKKTQ